VTTPRLSSLALGLALLALAHPALAAQGWTTLPIPAQQSYALLYVPASLDTGAPAPAIVFLHGSGATPEGWKLLATYADEQHFVLILPRAATSLNFGIGADDAIVAEAIRLAGLQVNIDPRRIGIAGHSAGGAYALVLAYATPAAFDGVFALSSPYRTVVSLADPARVPPLRYYYGTGDPNYTNAFPALWQMFGRLGVPEDLDLEPGFDHSNIPPESFRAAFAFLLAQPVPSCVPGPTALCLGGGRFRVEASWGTSSSQGAAGAVKQTDESGYFWFFDPKNVEVTVKVLDGCAANGHRWVYASGMTDVHVVLTVTDTRSGRQQSYVSAGGKAFETIRDIDALACD